MAYNWRVQVFNYMFRPTNIHVHVLDAIYKRKLNSAYAPRFGLPVFNPGTVSKRWALIWGMLVPHVPVSSERLRWALKPLLSTKLRVQSTTEGNISLTDGRHARLELFVCESVRFAMDFLLFGLFSKRLMSTLGQFLKRCSLLSILLSAMFTWRLAPGMTSFSATCFNASCLERCSLLKFLSARNRKVLFLHH